ncbi:MAG: OmpA family protein [Treponema sp.]|jgi:outer membrane protein OmpA-like peptidoglycan-associated protein|nr:OmpA family protein [Treponema sp.]
MQKFTFKTALLGAILYVMFLDLPLLYAQEHIDLVMAETGPYSLVERSDWRRYNNGKYVGLVHREVRASISPKPAPQNAAPTNTFLYQGNFFVLEETLRDMRASAQAVDEVVPVKFQLNKSGAIFVENDQGFPRLRGFPAFPAKKVTQGTKWTAPGSRIVDPLNTGDSALVPFTAEYEYLGVENYPNRPDGTPVHRIKAGYSARYQSNGADQTNFVRLQGNHTVDIFIRISDGLPLLMRDNLDETYFWADGSSVRFVGFTLTFGTGITPLDRDTLISSLENLLTPEPEPPPVVIVQPLPVPKEPIIAEPVEESPPPLVVAIEEPLPVVVVQPLPVPKEPIIAVPVEESPPPLVVAIEEPPPVIVPTPPLVIVVEKAPPVIVPTPDLGANIEVSSVPEGIRLTIKDIRFEPDSANFLPEETSRLDIIANALKQVPERTFLIEGHTASTGAPYDEMNLSIERAQRMVAAMVTRGISADRFIYKGWGGTKPVGDNASNAGRALNRRVEITILE